MKQSSLDITNTRRLSRSMVEPLEQRIAPAGLALDDSMFRSVTSGGTLLLRAGEGLSTSNAGGSYLLFIEKGEALVFTTDLNDNGVVDFNEITGIAAGNGLRLISFVDIHGDIVTNLQADGKLTDSDPNGGPALTGGRDGKVLLNSTIEKIELRSLTAADLKQPSDLNNRLALSSYSIFGNIYAGGNFGNATGGLLVDDSGGELLGDKYGLAYVDTIAEVGDIRVGTAASNQYFNFGISTGQDVRGQLKAFTPAAGSAGSDIINIGIGNTEDHQTNINFGVLQAGNGVYGGRGGNITNVTVVGDFAGGYSIIAGNGGVGPNGGVGGSITNFQDMGSITSQILLKAGDGGDATTGKGGNGGGITFVKDSVQGFTAGVTIRLGEGGDGITGGGSGGSLTGMRVETVGTGDFDPVDLVATYRQDGDIGQTRFIDFNGDGVRDIVSSTTNPNQLVVNLMGTGETLFLNGPASAQIAVADFNGDGELDIAAVSSEYSNAGVTVFLAQTDGSGAFTGFSQGLYSAIGVATQGALKATGIVAGDFNNDNIMDLAVSTVQSNVEGNYLYYLNGDSNGGSSGTGYFYADLDGSRFMWDEESGEYINLRASALQTGGIDMVFAGTDNDEDPDNLSNKFYVFSYTGGKTAHSFGKIDTNRAVFVSAKEPNFDDELFEALDFAILDINADGKADVVGLSEIPEFFLATLQGDGSGVFTIQSGDNVDQAGIVIPTEGDYVGILATDADNDGKFDDIALVDYQNELFREYTFSGFATIAAAGTDNFLDGAPITPSENRAYDIYESETVDNVGYFIAPPEYHSFDDFTQVSNGYILEAGDGGDAVLGAGGSGGSLGSGTLTKITEVDENGSTTISLRGSISILLPDTDSFEGSIRFFGGDGGTGFTNGGHGGSVSGVSVNYEGGRDLNRILNPVWTIAGDGGGGLTGNGGNGGGLKALAIAEGQVFIAGEGGRGVVGGSGGSISGAGIPVKATDLDTNNDGVDDVEDTIPNGNASTPGVVLRAGNGADGITKGGNGGNIDKFIVEFLANSEHIDGSFAFYQAGNGGNAVGGFGGSGGSILSSSPFRDGNVLDSSLYLQAGHGGNGLTGGNGGGIINFENAPTGGSGLSVVTVIAGHGGFGVTGNGGKGGSVESVVATAVGTGTVDFYDFSDIEEKADSTTIGDFFTTIQSPKFNRVFAGNGGDSFGATGGAGGSISNSEVSATGSGQMSAAGRGGDGLNAGGAGGAVLNTEFNGSALGGKVLVISGDGGDAYNNKAINLTDLEQVFLALGTVNGAGGNGGNITNFTQPNNTGTIVDLIAGNGGNLLNRDNADFQNANVGKGGSISSVYIEGSLGNTSAAVAINSYNDILAGESMADFVERFVSLDILDEIPLTDSVGNVGLVAGASGRVKDLTGDGEPDVPLNALNGSATNITVRNGIMSMVAGSVDRIAAIQTISGLNGGSGIPFSLLADKNPLGLPPQYQDSDGNNITTVVLDGRLVDGAIVYRNASGVSESDRIFERG